METDKVRILMTKVGHTAHYNADLIWVDGNPAVVYNWLDYNDGASVPDKIIMLDHSKLHPLPGWPDVNYMYELPVEVPTEWLLSQADDTVQ